VCAGRWRCARHCPGRKQWGHGRSGCGWRGGWGLLPPQGWGDCGGEAFAVSPKPGSSHLRGVFENWQTETGFAEELVRPLEFCRAGKRFLPVFAFRVEEGKEAMFLYYYYCYLLLFTPLQLFSVSKPPSSSDRSRWRWPALGRPLVHRDRTPMAAVSGRRARSLALGWCRRKCLRSEYAL